MKDVVLAKTGLYRSTSGDKIVSLTEVERILRAAADIVHCIYRQGTDSSRKADGSYLTRADTEANQFLQQELLRILPAAAWISEESAADADRLKKDWAWVVDPLDGTKEFVRRVPEFAISVGLVFRQQVRLGGIVNPVTGEGAVAEVGGESRFWNLPTPRAPAAALAEAYACVSRTETEKGLLKPYLNMVGFTQPVGSIAYKLLRVAAGVDHLTFSVEPKSEWDICGGVALLTAVGKTYRRLDGRPLRFGQPDLRIPCGAAAGPETLVSAFVSSWERLFSGVR
ncbi:3'(2'),5'-bisphosphate nucleotidase CysQ [bacterium]|nr:3'(2'),5'-bisphosphate nucleotidase CysQ [bacterium]